MGAAELCLGAVQEHPAPGDAVRQERGVLVLWVPDDPVALDGGEVLGGGEEGDGAGRAVRGAGDDAAVEFVDPDGACVVEAPLLARDLVVGRGQRLGIDRPATDAVRRAGDGEMRDTSAVLDPSEQDVFAFEFGSRLVEDGVDGIGPVLGREDRVAGVAAEELGLGHAAAGWRTGSRTVARTPAASRSRAAR